MAKKPPPEKQPWSPGGKRLARALHGCSMLPGSWDKRFARNMAEIADADDREPGKYGITQAQKDQLIRLAHKYRRQIPNWGRLIFAPAPMPTGDPWIGTTISGEGIPPGTTIVEANPDGSLTLSNGARILT